ncbi:MAG TPA: FoF1 ATP synthase subunit gamma [bacterium]|nr:FoF1 ATP synthase subunit gamma [bacterium]
MFATSAVALATGTAAFGAEKIFNIVDFGAAAGRDTLFEPSPAVIADHLVPHFAATELYHDLMESVASELSARMNAMEAATKNAAEMTGRLLVAYNKARQNAITTELMEIVGGAEAQSA